MISTRITFICKDLTSALHTEEAITFHGRSRVVALKRLNRMYKGSRFAILITDTKQFSEHGGSSSLQETEEDLFDSDNGSSDTVCG